MELFKLTVAVVSDVQPPIATGFSISARSETTTDEWRSKMLTVDEYRAAMSVTGLSAEQIEHPIRTRGTTTFGGRVAGSETVFPEEVLVKMGLRKQRI